MTSALAVRALAFSLMALAIGGCQSSGSSTSSAGLNARKNTITILNDQGGTVIGYAWQIKKVNEKGTGVRFAGRCDSACTLYLAAQRSCILPGATFGFHAPFGADPRGNKSIRSYMLRNYPSWVRGWLEARGGLTDSMKVMPYSYARQFIPGCDSQISLAALQ